MLRKTGFALIVKRRIHLKTISARIVHRQSCVLSVGIVCQRMTNIVPIAQQRSGNGSAGNVENLMTKMICFA